MTALLLLALTALALDAPGEVLPDRHWDFEHLHLDVTVDPAAGTVAGIATHTVRPLGAPHGWLRLHQVGLDIRAVQVDGDAAEGWRLEEHTLDVPMKPAPGARTVAITYAATPETGMHFRRPGRTAADTALAAWTQGQGEQNRGWFPGWDHPSDRFTLATDLTVPTGLHAVANGALAGTEDHGDGWTTWSYRLDERLVTYLVAAVVGEYQVFTDEAAGVPLEYVVPASVDEATARRTLGLVAPQLGWFGEILGVPYPYGIYRQALVERFLYSGMENTSLTLIGDHRVVPADDPAWALRTEGLLAHEVAHQWFGDLLTCRGWRDIWLNEGFATYWTSRWMEHAHGADFSAVRDRDNLEDALAQERPLAPRGLSPVGGRPAGAYTRGASVLRMLEAHLGREVFDAAVRQWVGGHRDQMVETDQLRLALEEASGQHLGWFFDRWVHSAGQPSLTTAWSWADGELAITVEPAEDSVEWPVPVAVEVGTRSGTRTARTWVGEGRASLVIPLETPPRWVSVDPTSSAVVRWEHRQPASAWAAQALESPSPHARLEAIHHLADGGASEAGALRQVARDREVHPRLRAEAAWALGHLPDQVDALGALLTDEDALVRAGAARGLGQGENGGRAGALLADAAKRDRAPSVRAAALHALQSADPTLALATSLARLRRSDPHPAQLEWAAAAGIVADQGKPGHAAALLGLLGPSNRRPGRLSAAEAWVDLAERHDLGRRKGARALEGWLDDPDAKVRRHALRLLGRAGDGGSVDALEAWARTTDLERHREAALDAAAAIRTREDPDAAGVSAEDRARLRQRIEALEERVERLEDRW